MRTKIGLALITLIIILLYINIYIFDPEKRVLFNFANSLVSNELWQLTYVLIYLLVPICLYMERDKLHDFYLDRTGIILFIVSSLFSIFNVGFIYYLIIISSTIWTVRIVASKWSRIRKTNYTWVRTSIFYTIPVIIVSTIVVLIYYYNTPFDVPENIPNVIVLFLLNIGLVAAKEEIIFRSIFWGYLNKVGVPIKYSFILQFVLFWFIHYEGVASDSGFYISLPLEIIVSSLLAYKSKQVTPAIVSHALYNSIATTLWMLFV